MLQQIKECANWCTGRVSRTAFVRYVSENPFSTMALCNIAGDSGFFGYALYSHQGISLIRLAGALSATAGHTILLAYGDEQMGQVLDEKGYTAKITLQMRAAAKCLTRLVTGSRKIARPFFCAFSLLALNGVALLGGSSLSFDFSSVSQSVLGATIIAGCGSFAAADLVRKQRTANILTKLAPTIFIGSNLSGIALGASTLNPFIVASLAFFEISNLAGYFTRIEKNLRPEAPAAALPLAKPADFKP